MRIYSTFALAVLLAVAGCSSSSTSLASASASYKEQRDYASLVTIHSGLIKGMSRTEVERLLGEPDYSPTDGQYYYSSDRKEDAPNTTDRPPATLGMVVDYRDASGRVTDQLQSFTLGPVGE